MRYIRLYVDHPRIGCGFRDWLVIRTGRVWAHLVSCDTAEIIKVPVGDLRFAKDLPVKANRRIKRLREVAKTYGQDTEQFKEALGLLKGQASA